MGICTISLKACCALAQEKRRREVALAPFQTAVTGALPLYRNAQRPGEPLGLGQVDPVRQSFPGLTSQPSLGNPLVEGLQNMQAVPGAAACLHRPLLTLCSVHQICM